MALDARSFDPGGRKQAVHNGDPHEHSPDAQIGPGLLILMLASECTANTKIGADCTIDQVCTMEQGLEQAERPSAITSSDATRPRDGAIIAPNSLVISDVPPGATAMEAT
jgi:serine acetyltransferase